MRGGCMRTEVSDAVVEWFCGAVIGAIPLVMHALAYAVLRPAAGDHVEGGWTIDVLFIAITISSTSIFSVVNRLRKTGKAIVKGRAAMALVLLSALFLLMSALTYAGVITGVARDNVINYAIGFVIGGAAISLYLEMTLATGEASAPLRGKRPKSP